MSAQQHLAQYGVTIDQARDFIVSNLSNLDYLVSICKQFGVTNAMLAEIYGGVTANDVIGFFSANGVDSTNLDSDTGDSGGSSDGGIQLVPDNLSGLLSLVSLNQNTGTLSNASLRDIVTGKVGISEYQAAFDPSNYEGADDGVFTAAELGVSSLGDLPATWETVESLFYGTLINTLRAIDIQEATLLSEFTTVNADGLAAQDPNVLAQYTDLLISIFEDPASFPLYNDALIQTVATTAAESFISIVGGNPDYSIISGLTDSFITT